MKIIKPSIEILTSINREEILKHIERCGRVCYKSEDKITEDSASKFVKTLIKNKHESVLEHVSLAVRVICDRGISHQIVRHRIASYSQEASANCKYKELIFIRPFDLSTQEYIAWTIAMETCEDQYLKLINLGTSPQIARSVLPNSLKTEIVMTMNLREWRHFFKLRTSEAAHPQMQEVANMILKEFNKELPEIFNKN